MKRPNFAPGRYGDKGLGRLGHREVVLQCAQAGSVELLLTQKKHGAKAPCICKSLLQPGR